MVTHLILSAAPGSTQKSEGEAEGCSGAHPGKAKALRSKVTHLILSAAPGSTQEREGKAEGCSGAHPWQGLDSRQQSDSPDPPHCARLYAEKRGQR